MVIRPSKMRLNKEEIQSHKNFIRQSQKLRKSGSIEKAIKVIGITSLLGIMYIIGCNNF